MITKEKYIEYLISTPINYTCTNLSEHLENISHDVISNYLKKSKLEYDILKGFWSDAGTFESLFRANTLVASQNASQL